MSGEMGKFEAWIFDCPVHGQETSVFCFLAFDEDNEDRWKRVAVEYTDLGASEWDIHCMVQEMRERRR